VGSIDVHCNINHAIHHPPHVIAWSSYPPRDAGLVILSVHTAVLWTKGSSSSAETPPDARAREQVSAVSAEQTC
jgi:hypothetical protein